MLFLSQLWLNLLWWAIWIWLLKTVVNFDHWLINLWSKSVSTGLIISGQRCVARSELSRWVSNHWILLFNQWLDPLSAITLFVCQLRLKNKLITLLTETINLSLNRFKTLYPSIQPNKNTCNRLNDLCAPIQVNCEKSELWTLHYSRHCTWLNFLNWHIFSLYMWINLLST